MTDPNFVILYVDSPTKSAEFYADLLKKKPLEASATFAMFALDSGVMLASGRNTPSSRLRRLPVAVESSRSLSPIATLLNPCMPIGPQKGW